MVRSLRTVVAALVLVWLAGALPGVRGDAQQQPPTAARPLPDQQPPPADQPQRPLFRTGINFVRVDVIVSDRQGNTPADLVAADFDVTEDGKPQTIETFKLIKLDGGSGAATVGESPKPIRSDYDEESEAARDDVRLFAVFLDDYHVRLGSSLTVREPLTQFIRTQLGASDMIGVMYPLEPLAQVRMTRNHEAIVGVIEKFLGRKYDYTPRNDIEWRYANYPAAFVEQIRNQVSLSAIKGLVTHMGSLKEGRKALILVSEGYSNILPPQLRDPVATMPGFGNPQRDNPMAGVNNPTEDRAAFLSNLELQTDLREVFDSANRNNTAIYTVDPRGLASGAFDINEGVNIQTDREYLRASIDTLHLLAEGSDGRAIVNQNDLEKGMRQIVRDSSAYYLIGYSSTQMPSDGRFHEIKVRVKRPGMQVRARKGYWALNAEETMRATAAPKPGLPPGVEAALATVDLPTRARVIRTWVGTSRGENGRTKITFVWEPVAKPAGDRERTEAPARVALTAVGPGGAPYFRGRVPEAPPASTGTTGATTNSAALQAPARVTFDADPGTLQLRVSVESAGAQVIDSEIREMVVPDLTAHTSLGTPAVFRARTAREFQQINADPAAVPVAVREFSRTDRLLIRVPAFGPGTTAPSVTARLLNRTGQPMLDLAVAPAGASSTDQQVDLPLAGLAAGDYVIEIKTTGESGDTKELVGFRVAS
jgi:VWFA-related protein